MSNMFKQKPFPFCMLILAVLVVLHAVGSYYSWYWVYPWFDVPVHIMSGLWIGLVFLWLSSVFDQINSLKEYRAKSFLVAFVSAILIGVIWELVENYYQLTFIRDANYGLNTALDILNDGLGGVLAYLYFVRRKKCLEHDPEIMHPFYNQTGLIKS